MSYSHEQDPVYQAILNQVPEQVSREGQRVPRKKLEYKDTVFNRVLEGLDKPRRVLEEKFTGLQEKLGNRVEQEKNPVKRLFYGIGYSTVSFGKGFTTTLAAGVSPYAIGEFLNNIGDRDYLEAMKQSLKTPGGAAEFLGSIIAPVAATKTIGKTIGRTLGEKRAVEYGMEPRIRKINTAVIEYPGGKRYLVLENVVEGKAVKAREYTPTNIDYKRLTDIKVLDKTGSTKILEAETREVSGRIIIRDKPIPKIMIEQRTGDTVNTYYRDPFRRIARYSTSIKQGRRMKEIDAVIIENPSKETLRHIYEITRRLDITDRENTRFTRVVAKEKTKPSNTMGSRGSQEKTGATPTPTAKTILKDTSNPEIKIVDKLLNKKPGSLKVIEYKTKNTIIPSPPQLPIKGSSKSQVKTGKTGKQKQENPLIGNTGQSKGGSGYGPGPIKWREPQPLDLDNSLRGRQETRNKQGGKQKHEQGQENRQGQDNENNVQNDIIPDRGQDTIVVNPPANTVIPDITTTPKHKQKPKREPKPRHEPDNKTKEKTVPIIIPDIIPDIITNTISEGMEQPLTLSRSSNPPRKGRTKTFFDLPDPFSIMEKRNGKTRTRYWELVYEIPDPLKMI